MRTFTLCALLTGCVLSLAADARAEDLWATHGEDCDARAFQNALDVPLPQIGRCVRLWEAYRDVKNLPDPARVAVVTAMKRLYMDGDDFDAHIARLGLQRLGVTQLPPRRGVSTSGARPGRQPCEDPPPSDATLKKARKALKKGLKAYRKGRLDDALRAYERAADIAPGWPRAHYNRGAIHAAQANEEGAIDALLCVRDLGGDEGVKYLRKARTDRDFSPIRDESPAFKEITQYARIQLANSLGELGEDNVENAESTLDALGFAVEQVTLDPRPRREPHSWFKPHSVVLAYIITKILNHPETVLKPISWEDEDYDIKISWGDTVVPDADPTIRVQDPEDATKLLDQYKKAERDALAQPDKMKAQANSAVSDVKGNVDKVTDTVDTLKGAVDTLKGF